MGKYWKDKIFYNLGVVFLSVERSNYWIEKGILYGVYDEPDRRGYAVVVEGK